MAERKLTKSELKMKQRDPKKFAELQKIRARRAKGYKRTLGPKVVKPTKKKKVKRNQRIGGGTLYSKLSKDSVTDSAKKREDKVRPKITKPVIAIKPSVTKDSKKRGSMKPGLNAAVKSANKREDKIRPFKKKKPTVVKPTSRKTKPISTRTPYYDVNEIDYNTDLDEEGISNEMPKKLKTLGEAMFSSDQTPENEMVRNPFTGKPMSLEYDFPEDPEDMKKGGSIKKKMKKGKVKKRAALRGQGKAALRGF